MRIRHQRRDLLDENAASTRAARSDGSPAPVVPHADPGTLANELAVADGASRASMIGGLQQTSGNAVVGQLLARGQMTVLLTQSAGRATGESGPGDPGVVPAAPAVAERPPAGTTDITLSETSYELAADSLAGVASLVEGRGEAGSVTWEPTMTFDQEDGVVTSATVTVPVTLEMPAWTPPGTMGPKARAEWRRAYAALLAHEQGHIDLVHKHFDGLAEKMIGKQATTASRLFAAAKGKLARDSRAYDARTRHGRKTGTVIDVSVEEREKAEAEKKEK